MLRLTVLKNIFDKDDIETRELNYVPGKSVYEYIQGAVMMDTCDLLIVHNGKKLEGELSKEVIPGDGDFIGVYPVVGSGDDGKKALAAIVMVLVMIYAPQAGAAVGAKMGAFWGFMAQAAIVVGGSLIVQNIMDDLTDEKEKDKGYFWNGINMRTGEGNAVQMTYGKMRTGGQLINAYRTFEGDKQYLNLLLCGGEGPCDYIGDGEYNGSGTDNVPGISDIMIDGNPIENFNGVVVYKRAGLNTQSAIPEFAKKNERAMQFFSYTLDEGNDWITHTTAGDGGRGLEVTFSFPQGLFHVSSEGKFTTTSVTLLAQYSLAGQNKWKYIPMSYGTDDFSALDSNSIRIRGNDILEYLSYRSSNIITLQTTTGTITANILSYAYYSNQYDPNYGYTVVNLDRNFSGTVKHVSFKCNRIIIRGNKNVPFTRAYKVDNIPQGQYDVRCRCIDASSSSKDTNTVVWDSLAHIVYDDFTRPNKILLGIKALATDQLSGGLPNITWVQKRSKVRVWVPEDITKPYGAGTYQLKDANNPAWACYDVIHRCRYMKDLSGRWHNIVKGVPAASIDYRAFKNWADYCDEVVDGQPRLRVNYIIDKTTTLMDALAPISFAGRGTIRLKGTKVSCLYYGPKDPEMLYSASSMKENSYQVSYTDIKDRANAVEISFLNEDKNYQKETIIIKGSNYDEDEALQNPRQIPLEAVTNYKQAYREGVYYLNSNTYINESVTFLTDLEGMKCEVGDVILVQNDVSLIGEYARVLSATSNTVTLDKPVTMIGETNYNIIVRYNDTDELVTKSVVSIPETALVDKLTISDTFSRTPSKYDLVVFGEPNKEAKSYRVQSIERMGDMSYRVTAVEYNDSIFSDEIEVVVPDYTLNNREIHGLHISEHTDENEINYLDIAWFPTIDFIDKVKVYIDGKKVGEVDSYLSEYSHKIYSDLREYKVKLVGIDNYGNEYASSQVLYTAVGQPLPPDVTTLTTSLDPTGSVLSLYWNPVEDYRMPQYEIRLGTHFDTAPVIGLTPPNANTFTLQGDGTYWVSAYWRGYRSENPDSVTVVGGQILKNVVVDVKEEELLWPGTITEGLIVSANNTVTLNAEGLFSEIPVFSAIESLLLYGGVNTDIQYYTIPVENQITLYNSSPCRISITTEYTTSALSGYTGDPMEIARCIPQIQIAGDDDIYGDWKDFVPGKLTVAKKFNFRVKMYTTDYRVSPILTKFGYMVDVPDVIKSKNDIEVPATGASITFDEAFNTVPTITPTIIDSASGDIPCVYNVTKEGFDIIIYNNGNGQARTFGYIAKGY